jgi:hypothetical protein
MKISAEPENAMLRVSAGARDPSRYLGLALLLISLKLTHVELVSERASWQCNARIVAHKAVQNKTHAPHQRYLIINGELQWMLSNENYEAPCACFSVFRHA